MKKVQNFLSFTLGLTFTVGLGFLFYKLVKIFALNLDRINPNILVAIIAGTVTILGYFITRYLERKKLIEQQIRDQKLPTYEEFLDFIFELFKSTKKDKPLTDEELQEFYWKFNKRAILWLSDRTLKSYIDWRNSIVKFSQNESKSQEENAKTLLAFENLLLDFRKDIGHDNKNISPGSILSMFINDWETYSKNLKN